MTATNFRDLLGIQEAFFAGRSGHRFLRPATPEELLARPVPWVDCPTCCQAPHPRKRGCKFTPRNMMVGWFPCHACAGTGKASVAQLLAWGQAVAQTDPEDWIEFSDQRSTVTGYRNQILGVTP